MRGAVQEGPWLRAHKRASRRDPGVRAVRRGARGTHHGLRLERYVLAAQPRCRRKRGRHDGAAAGSGTRGGGADRVPGSPADGVVPVVPGGRPSSGEADEHDGGRRVPRAPRLLVPVGGRRAAYPRSPAASRAFSRSGKISQWSLVLCRRAWSGRCPAWISTTALLPLGRERSRKNTTIPSPLSKNSSKAGS